MRHPLEQKLAALRSRVQRLVALDGLSRVATAVVAAVIVLGLIDYLVRFEDPGLRLMASLAVLGAFGWTCYRRLFRTLLVRLRDIDLARRVEQRFPNLGDRLASAVEFLRQSEQDPTAGSVALRRKVIAETTAETQDVDFQAVLRRGPVVRAATAAAGVVLVAMILAVLNPLACGIAVARLANPLADISWPKTNHLTFRQPVYRVARGQTFEVEVVDRFGARLPADVRIHYRFRAPDGPASQEVEPMRREGEALVARRENVTRPFSYRVRGGDDNSMPWIPVEVIEPPAIESLAARLIPPPYTGWPAEDADKGIRALTGTRVEMSARATKPLRSAVLVWLDRPEIPCRLSEDGLSLDVPADPAVPLGIDKSGNYWFRLTDQDGISGGSDARWEVRAVPDAPPTVSIERPSANVFVTPTASVPLTVGAKDDLAVRRIWLEFSRSDRPGEASAAVSLYAGPERVAARPAGMSDADPRGESRQVVYDWNLAGLGLQPGTQVNFHAMAADYLPQTGTSDPRRLVIITPEELADRIAARQAALLGELARVLEMQRQSRQQVTGLEIQVRQAGRLGQLDLDHLRGAELNQRQVNQTLTSRAEGVPMHILGLLADLKNNKLDSPETERQMHGLLAEIDRLAKDHLPAISQQLTAASKAVQIRIEELGSTAEPSAKPQQQRAIRPDPTVAPSLAAAGKHQDHVIASLEQMLGHLSRWDSYRRFQRDIAQLLRDQEELSRRTADVGRRTLTKDVRDLLPQESADLKIAAQQQFQTARRLDRIQQDMEQALGPLCDADPVAAETVSDALQRARQLTIAGQMRSAAEGIESNRMGQAMDRQRQVVEGLQEILDILANRREPELTRLLRKLREAEKELAELTRRQDALRKQMEQAQATADPELRRRQLEPLGREQDKLRDESQRLGRRLELLAADAAAKSVGRAAEKMNQAGQSASQGRAGGAAENAAEARKDLQEAARQLSQQRRQAEAQLAADLLTRLQDVVRSARQRQEKLLADTRRVDQLRQGQGRLTRDQAATIRELARGQGSLQAETAELAERLASAEVFHVALSVAADEMSRATELLEGRQTDARVQRAEQDALRRLDQVLAALEPEKPLPGADQNAPGGQAGQGGQGREPPIALRSLAELKLVRMLQEEVNRRTRELEEAFGRPEKLTDEARRQYGRLGDEQGRLANLLLHLLQPAENPEDNPDNPQEPGHDGNAPGQSPRHTPPEGTP